MFCISLISFLFPIDFVNACCIPVCTSLILILVEFCIPVIIFNFWYFTQFIYSFYHPEFDETVQRSKEDAEEALKKIPQIEDQIELAEETTRDARDDLSDAENNAIRARSIAEDARDTGKMASEVTTFYGHYCDYIDLFTV